ncbi:hypothetical protein SAMN04487926_12159 [Paraburkholderia steynii]|uniref:Uncharacterized protein n=1 Tax=Paraburkholderia steynii TaxID=1245441 RepID=A0A7Z7BEG9_9BURK|nr:hypothetical protein [Paraburkholderia steynii]SDI65390.1 hypothetical protein SAMN04487926_12159 [Paraburkholderia steynii]
MARIPLGNQGDAISTPPQQVQTSAADFGGLSAAAKQGLGTTLESAGQQLAFQQQKLNDDLQRTAAASAYQQHSTNVQIAMRDAGAKLQAGELDQTGYQSTVQDAVKQSYDSTIGGLPDNHYKNVAALSSKGLDRTVALGTQEALTKNTQQLIGANAASMLDTAGKNIAVNPAAIDSTVEGTKANYLNAAAAAGISKPVAEKTAQDWSDAQYAQHAQAATISARSNGDLAALTQLQSDLTKPDGFYAGKMDANQRNQVLSSVVSQRMALENQMGAEQQARENGAVTEYNKAFDLMTQGKQFSPAYSQALTAATAGTSLAGQAQELIKSTASNAGFSTLPLPQMRAAIQADQKSANTPGVGTDPVTAEAVKQRQQILTASETAYKTDPWNAALDRGVIQQVPQIDSSSIPNLLTSLQQRGKAAGVVDQAAGRTVSLLTPDEAQTVLKTVEALPVDQQAQMLNGIGGSFGQGARINDLAKQWQEKNPAMALALKAGAAGGNGSPLTTITGQPVGAFILSGQQAIKDKTVKVDDTVGTGMRATISNAVDGALPPEQATDAKESAYYIAIGSAARNGRAVPNSTDIQDGINAATGGISTTGGTRYNGNPNRVAMPYGWLEKDFQSSVKNADASNIENTVGGKPIDTVYANGHPLPVADFMSKFPSYQMVRVGVRGTYAVVAGSKFVTDSTGVPVTVRLQLGQKPATTTAPTVPGQSPDQINNPF